MAIYLKMVHKVVPQLQQFHMIVEMESFLKKGKPTAHNRQLVPQLPQLHTIVETESLLKKGKPTAHNRQLSHQHQHNHQH